MQRTAIRFRGSRYTRMGVHPQLPHAATGSWLPSAIPTNRVGSLPVPELLHLGFLHYSYYSMVCLLSESSSLSVPVAPTACSNHGGNRPLIAYASISSRVIRSNSWFRLTCSVRSTHCPLALI